MKDAPLPPELRDLPAPARRVWGDPGERARALEAIARAWEQQDLSALRAAVQRVDDAVVLGLRAFGLPRGPITGRRKAGMNTLDASYNYYVRAYETLAEAVGISVEALWRRLWQQPCGNVRAALVDAVDDLRAGVTGQRLTTEQRRRLQALADQAFSAARERNAVGDVELSRARWELAFR